MSQVFSRKRDELRNSVATAAEIEMAAFKLQFIDKIQEVMKDKRIQIEDLAKLTGKHGQELEGIFQKHAFSLKNVFILAWALGLEFKWELISDESSAYTGNIENNGLNSD